MKKGLIKTIALGVVVTSLTGCMGQMGASGMVLKGNLSAVDNRYARAGLYALLSPVYGIAATADLFIFNSVELWTGRNPLTGKGQAVADTKINTVIQVNDKLDKSMTTVPLANLSLGIQAADLTQIDANTLAMNVTYDDGKTAVLSGKKRGEMVDFYLDGHFITHVSVNDLANYTASKA